MKIIFLSDIHGIYENLDLIDKIIENEKIDKIVVLGDLYYYGPNYNGNKKVNSVMVKDFLTKHSDKLICMRGNCDSDVDVKVSDFPICSGLSMLYIDDLNIYVTHGNEYNKEKTNKFNNREGVLVYGHEHIPYIEKNNNMIYINVGSISLPRNGNLPTYMIYEKRCFKIYNINKEIVNQIEV